MLFSRKLGSLLKSVVFRKVKKSNPMRYGKRKSHQNTISKLLQVLHPASKGMGNKVSIIGCGQVGMACAITILSRLVTHHVCLYDTDYDRLQGEVLDLQHGSIFLQDATIEAAADLKKTENSVLCVVSAGFREKRGENALNLLERNIAIFKSLIPELVSYSPNTILLIVTNPVDIMSYVAWKLSGLPVYRVFGTGTSLDTARFRELLGQKIGISPKSVHGVIIGEHGDNSVANWSGLHVGGSLLNKINRNVGRTDDPENWGDFHSQVLRSPIEVIRLKGYTNWAIALNVADITWACLGNTLRIYPVSTSVKGIHGIEDEVYLSLPCVMSTHGISKIVIQSLTKIETEKLQNCAKLMKVVHRKLKV